MNNRIYKFRAWDKDDKKMHYSPSITGLHSWFGDYFNEAIGDSHAELMQYTGRKDKRDVEIYDGDIVVTGLGDVYLVQVKNFSDGYSFHFAKNGYLEKYVDGKDTIEIIGNIYENPELYEENK